MLEDQYSLDLLVLEPAGQARDGTRLYHRVGILTLKIFKIVRCAKPDEEQKRTKNHLYSGLDEIRQMLFRRSRTRGRCFKDSKEVMEEIREESWPRERVHVV